jgi:hypothetical protein
MGSPVHAQDPVMQTATVGVVFVDFSDADTDLDAGGGRGYTAPPRVIDTAKYQAQYWYDFFFKEEGHVSHPDSLTHLDIWSGDWAPYQLGSLSRWCRENSYGRHRIEPYSANGKDGILNVIDSSGKIEWIRLNDTKSYLMNSQAFNNPLVHQTYQKLDYLFQGLPDRPTSVCDVIVVVYAGCSFGMYYAFGPTEDSPCAPVISEKTGNPATPENAILQFEMSAAVHEYVHVASEVVIDTPAHPLGMLYDYGYDWMYGPVTRSRWLGITAMYGYGVPSRPLHLDPWAKLMLGWVDYQILDEGEYFDVSLPIIAQPADGVVPHVLVIPIDVPWTTESPDWYRGHYLIIENRRRIDNSFDMTLTGPNSPGGMVVWEYDEHLIQDKRGGLTVVEADGNYDMKFTDQSWVKSHLPAGTPVPFHLYDPTPNDFWHTTSLLSTWSHHLLGRLDPTTMQNANYAPALSRSIPRQITIRFDDYIDNGNTNTIPYISVGAPTSNVHTATRNNNQRKLLKLADELVFVATSDFDGDEMAGTITVHTSPDAGDHWTELRVLNAFDVWRDTSEMQWDPALSANEQDINRWRPAVRSNGATAPAITRIADSWGVVWQQREGAGQSRVLFSSPEGPPVDVLGASIDRLNDEVTPVIAWGRVDPTTSATLLKVIVCSDSGLIEAVSTDNGISFPDTTIIAGTGTTSRNPSLAMSPDHEILVYEQGEKIFAIINGASPVNLSALHPEFRRNMSPSVALAESTVHVVWTAEVEEEIPDLNYELHTHIKPVHKIFDIAAGPDENVATFLNLKNNKLEEARHPVIATKHSLSNEQEAVVVWSVFDGVEGARLRYAEPAWNPSISDYEWPTKGMESTLSTQSTFHPAIAGDAGETRFIVMRGDESPYRIQCATPEPLVPNPFVGEKEVLINLLDTFDATGQNSVRLEDVLITSQGQLLGRASNAGVPFAGFDGSHDGPPLSLLSMSEEILLQKEDTLAWTLHIHRMPTNRYFDTTEFRVDMYDALDSSVIASSAVIRIPPGKADSTFTVELVLPASHYPSAPIRLSVDVSGAAYDQGARYYSATKTVFMTTDISKQARQERDTDVAAKALPSVDVFPQPAGSTLRLVHRMAPDAHATVTLHDNLGRMLRRRTVDAGSDGLLRVELDVADLRPGVYDCRITSGESSVRRMVSIVR